jgi:hypothetical protein
MGVFEIAWNITGLLYAFVGLVALTIIVFLIMAFVAGIADKGEIKKKMKGDDKDGRE